MRSTLVALTIAAATVATGAAGVATVDAMRAGEALPGVNIAGAPVSGQDEAQLRATIEGLDTDRTTGTLPVVADDVQATVDRSLVRVDVDATIDAALDAGREGYPLAGVFGPVFGTGRRTIEPVLVPDGPGLDQQITELAAKVDRKPDDGGFLLAGTDDAPTVTAKAPLTGRTLDQDGARAAIIDALRERQSTPATLPVAIEQPGSTPEQVQALTAAATKALDGPYVLATGDVRLTLAPKDVAPLLTTKQSDTGPTLEIDPPALAKLVESKAGPLATRPRSAGFDVAGVPATLASKGNLTWTPKPAEVRVRPGANGKGVDVEAASTALAALIRAGKHDPAALPLKVLEPSLTTDGATAAGVKSLIGTFTTSFTAGQPRARNIRRIAELVDGTYVAPGEQFSLNGAAGERTKGRGFVADGAIVDGELTDEVGGGVSQFATTLFNAAFFAGLPIPEHKPHSFYISRYPAGRESTVYFGALDVRFDNDTANGLLVRTRSTPGSVTVELYGDNGGRKVTSTTGPRRARDDGGFRIDVTRTISGGDGKGTRRVFKTSYDPVPPEN